jgi:hypothetical protein
MQGSDSYSKSLQQYTTEKIGDLGKKLENANKGKLELTG